mgnify:CR=1 FL=1
MGEYKVYLGNIPDDTRDRDVEKLFKGYGRIRNVVIKVSHDDVFRSDRILIAIFRGTSKEPMVSVSLMT